VWLEGTLACFGVLGYIACGVAEPGEKVRLLGVIIDTLSVAEPGKRGPSGKKPWRGKPQGGSGAGKLPGLSCVSSIVDPRRAKADGQSEARNG
jgi:hypothetical protein